MVLMQKLILTIGLLLITSACSFPGVYKVDVQQGNIITQEMVDQLKPGMTKSQVRFIMGTPLLVDSFHQERWDYLYSIQPGGEKRRQEHLTLFFEDDKLARFEGDFMPGATDPETDSDDDQDEANKEKTAEEKSWSIRSLWPFELFQPCYAGIPCGPPAKVDRFPPCRPLAKHGFGDLKSPCQRYPFLTYPDLFAETPSLFPTARQPETQCNPALLARQ
jgi:outer membrane protein assembly factor BamE